MKYDLHIHSKYPPDGILGPKKIVKIPTKSGLNGIAITDRNTIKVLSEEIKSKDVQGVILEIKGQGGFVVIPRPFDELRHSAFHPTEEDVKIMYCVEGFNSSCVFQKYNKKAVEFAMRHNLTITAGSDAHFSNDVGNAEIVPETGDVREAIMKNDIMILGERTSLVNHVGTKVLKLRRKTAKKGMNLCSIRK